MPIERAVYDDPTWVVYWTAPGGAPSRAGVPVASFTATQDAPGGPVDFDGSASFETGGTIVRWTWDFGDGSAALTSGASGASHNYGKTGSYNASLIVTDSTGHSAQTTRTVRVIDDVVPISSFVANMTDLTVSVDGSGSSDIDGAISSYDWDFGDGAIANGPLAQHTYAFGGTYAISLAVTDNLGRVAISSQNVTPSYLPDAEFTYNVSGLTVHVDASESTDFNPISKYAWSWGVAGSVDSTGLTASHTYAADGTYPISLTITDVAGHQDTVTNLVAVASIAVPEPPVVKFTSTVTNLTASFNASGTTDIDSTIASYAWSFGDTHTGTGVTTSHTYSSGGTYSVSLTATDHLGASATLRKSVTVSTAPPPSVTETVSFPYTDRNRRQVISDDNYDPDTSWDNHRARGSLGGVDHNAPYGTPLYANCTGHVRLISLANGGTGGRTLNLYLGSTGWYDQYMHLSSFAVSDGEHVTQGQLVGHSGASGDGSDYFYAPHFHLHRYTPGGTRVNAWHYFAGSGTSDSRDIKPGLIQVTVATGVPNLAYWRRLQWYAHLHGYAYPCDGYMSIPAWKGVQRGLKSDWGYGGSVDGLPGTETYKALQRMAHAYGSTSPIDGSLSVADHIGISKRLNLL